MPALLRVGSGFRSSGGSSSSSSDSWQMAILRRDSLSQSSRRDFIFLSGLLHRTARHQILQLLISAQAKHLLAAAGRISRAQIFMHDVEELLELERCAPGQHGDELFGH
ncbi:MAG: hypothetical protein ACR2MF_00610 [Chthoniobacterales bacterium]